MLLVSPSWIQKNNVPVVAALLCLMTVIAGCGPEPGPSVTSIAPTESRNQSTLDSCRTRLEGAARRLRPDSLVAVNEIASNVSAFNGWLTECALDGLEELQVSEANLAFLDSSAQRSVSAPRFTARDAVYIRDSLIASQLAQAIVERPSSHDGSEVSRILSIFRWVGNNISLEDTAALSSSKGFLDTLLSGRGTVRSRVWILAVLLRQLQTDVVILLPHDTPKGSEDHSEFLIAVCVNDDVLLFDPLTWLPIPSEEDDSIQINEPAGSEYLAANEKWHEPQVRIIAETSAICPRMLILQDQLPVELSAMLYEEIAGGTSEIRPLIDRVISSGPGVFLAEHFARWDWPDQQAIAAIAPDEAQQRTHDQLMKPFEAPYNRPPLELDTDFNDVLSDPTLTAQQRESLWEQKWKMEVEKIRELEKERDVTKLFGRPSSYLLKIRLEQVEGSSDRRIIQQLLRIRNACIDDAIQFTVPRSVDHSGQKSIPIPESLQKVNREAGGNALYWIALCQIDRSQLGTAISSFMSYRRQYPEGKWFYPSLMNQALSEMALERHDAAVVTFSEADHESNPDRKRVGILLKRLRAAIEREKSSAGSVQDASSKFVFNNSLPAD
ncbi:MAG: hypothetical protein MK110_14565 [Fuerstiella sp.]|nr:hypothetical protein [Fuerstiella sp.]